MRKALRAIRLLRKHGIEHPIITYQEAKRAGIPLAVLAAVLDQETGGGRNVFGHDPTIYAGAGKVTKEKYLAYKKARGPRGQGGMQGVGPMQLTWYAYQDLADRYGGAWKPRANIRVGAEILALNRKKHSWRETFKVYNGSWSYADSVMRRVAKWRHRLAPKPRLVKPRQGFSSLHSSLWAAYSEGRRRKFSDLGTYANKSGDHGYWPAWAFDLGFEPRTGFKNVRAAKLARWYVKHRKRLNIEYVILGMRIWSRTWWFEYRQGWHRYRGDTSHMFHIHVSGHH